MTAELKRLIELALFAAATVGLLALSAGADQPTTSEIVYYQVTEADGTVRDQAQPPATHEGVRRVVRISRAVGAGPTYRTYATGPTGVSVYNPPRVRRDELAWNGRAWVDASQLRAARGESPDPAQPLRDKLRRQGLLLREGLDALTDRRDQLRRRLAELDPDDPNQSERVERLAGDARRTDRLIKHYRRALATMTDEKTALGRPTGQVRPLGDPPDTAGDGRGIVQPIDTTAALRHHVQVWKLPDTGGGRYTVSMAHPQPGQPGGLYYVAYADTDADGTPDRLVAHSPLAEATRPGGWTQWSFTADRGDLYVGAAWPDSRPVTYLAKADPAEENWRGLSSEVWISGVFGACPQTRAWPVWGNLYIRHENPDPDYLPPGPKVEVLP
jgi:hypothetical protein